MIKFLQDTVKSLVLSLVAFAVAGSAAAVGSSDSRWRVSSSGEAIEWPVADDARLPHRDWMEMGGRKVALLFDNTVSEKRTLTLSRRVVWPCVRTQPNNTHASMSFEFSTNGIPCLTADGAVLEETVSKISFGGVWSSVGTTPSGLRVERRVFPSAAAPAAFERWTVTNARLPKGLRRMALRNVRAFGRVFDIEADEKGARIDG